MTLKSSVKLDYDFHTTDRMIRVAAGNTMVNRIKRNSVIAYFIIAYAVSWSFEIPLALVKQGLIGLSIPLWFHYFVALGPLMAALFMTFLTEGRAGLRELIARIFKWRVGLRYYAFAILIPVGLFTIACLLDRTLTGHWPDLGLLGEVDYLPYLTPWGALGVWLITFGLGEEVGWRGYALPHLQKTRSAATATLLLGILWVGWHLPMFFYRDTYMQMGLMGFPMLGLSLICAAMVFTWLYNSTAGSLWIVILFHGVFDWLSSNEAGGPFAAALLSMAVILWALYIPRRYGMENAAASAKQIA
jgi:CAAX protease family protein